MNLIKGCIFFILILLVALIMGIVKKEKKGSIITCIIMIIGFGILLIFFIKDYKYGNYADLVNKYGMVHSGDKDNGTYTKDNLVFHYNTLDESFEEIYSITDFMNMNINLQARIISYLFDFKEGTIQLIYNYLKDYSEHLERNSEIVIFYNHSKLSIYYYYQDKKISYNVTRQKQYRYENDKEKTEKNSNYSSRCIDPELRINHYNDDYQETDNELINLLFNKNISDANVKLNDSYGIHELSYCFSSYCYGNY